MAAFALPLEALRSRLEAGLPAASEPGYGPLSPVRDATTGLPLLELPEGFRYTTFAERSLLFQSFTPFRHIGVGFYNHADNLRATWAASAFRSGQDQFGDSISTDGGWSGAGRATCLPWYDEAADGRYYLHLGGAYWFNTPQHHLHRFRTIPEYFIGENIGGDIGTSLQAVPGALESGAPTSDTVTSSSATTASAGFCSARCRMNGARRNPPATTSEAKRTTREYSNFPSRRNRKKHAKVNAEVEITVQRLNGRPLRE